MKRLNNKGFTLIELLAVIVILAVVMGVATTQVLSAMNNSRKSSLLDSAKSAADAFRTAYAEYSMGAETGNGILGFESNETDTLIGGTPLNLNAKVGAKLNITIGDNGNYTTDSFVYYDTTSNTFTVCLVANKKGSYYVAAVANAAESSGKSVTKGNGEGAKTISGQKMWACSDDEKSW